MTEFKKIVTHDDVPPYYKDVILIANGKIYYQWHRLGNGENEFYGSLLTDLIIDGKDVTHWRDLLELPENL